MEPLPLLNALLSTQSPVLPWSGVERAYLALAWGLVLAALTARLARHETLPPGLRRWLPAAVLLWCLLPGPLAPSYWLGLAFRAPSTLFAALAAWTWWEQLRPQSRDVAPLSGLRASAGVGILAGWVLLLDVFAVWPVSVYAWGFAPALLGGLSVLGLLPWFLRGERAWSALLMAALLLHVLLRLPTGNAWDAWLDPWLWLALQLDWLWRRWRKKQGNE